MEQAYGRLRVWDSLAPGGTPPPPNAEDDERSQNLKDIERGTSTWAPAREWDPFAHIKLVSSVAISRPDPPEESKFLEEESSEPYIIEASYAREVPDDSSETSNWGPPSRLYKKRGAIPLLDNKTRAPVRRLEQNNYSDLNSSFSSQVSDWKPPRRVNQIGRVFPVDRPQVPEPPLQQLTSLPLETSKGSSSNSSTSKETSNGRSTLSKSYESSGSSKAEFAGFDASMVLRSWGLPILQKTFTESANKREDSINDNYGESEEEKKSVKETEYPDTPSLMEEGRIFTHDEGSEEDETEGSISSDAEASSNLIEVTSDAESESSEVSADLEDGRLSSSGSSSGATPKSIGEDPDVMKRTPASNYLPPATFSMDIEQGSPVGHKGTEDVTQVKGARSPWLVAGVLCCVLICLVIGGGIAAIVLFVFNDSEPSNPPTFAPTPTIAPGGPTPPPSELELSPETFIAASLASVEGADALKDPTSPQSKALSWVLSDPLLRDYSQTRLLQRYTMASLYYSSAGDFWTNKNGWLTGQNECEWYTAESETAVCTAEGLLDQFDLDENNLGGTIPWADLSMLSNQLRVIDFFDNRIAGTFPSPQMGSFTVLEALDLYSNEFSGTLPTETGLLTSLRYLDVDTNFLTGGIPTEISRLTMLETLWLSNNLLSGSIPTELGRLTNLRNLHLTNNYLTGSMPAEICALRLESLEVTCSLVECDCCTNCNGNSSGSDGSGSGGGSDGNGGSSGDQLYDMIVANSPDGGMSLQDPASPQSAALQWLRRPINEGFSDARMLQRYALAVLYFATGGDTGNWITTSLWLTGSNECLWYTTSESSVLCSSGADGSDNLYLELNLSQNGLVGSLPPEIAMLTSLRTIRLSQNELTGAIPSSLADLKQLAYLDLSTNRMTQDPATSSSTPSSKTNIFAASKNGDDGGDLFGRLGELQSLTHLSLFQNLFSTTIPSSLGLLARNLRILDLGSNNLYGTIPSEVGLLTNLVGLSIFDNALSGSLPESLSDLTKLEMLYMDANDLGPPIPLGVCQLSSLNEFWSDCEEVGCVCCTTCCSDSFGCVPT